MADWNWYITVAATKQLMQVAGLRGPLEDDNPAFVAAERMLGQYSLTAREVAGAKSLPGCKTYRTNGKVEIGGRKTRLEFTVSFAERSEGDLPQLVFVRDKGGHGKKKPRGVG